MSLKNSIHLEINWINIDVLTFGKCCLYGYDSINHSIRIKSFDDLNNIRDDCLHLSSSPSWPIRRLILNDDQTILALIADSLAYLVYLPEFNQQNSSSKGSSLCSISRVPNPNKNSSMNCSLIDFLWLDSKHFLIVYFRGSFESECNLYRIESSKENGIKYIRSFSIGNSKIETSNKKISLHQPSNIIKLDRTKRNNQMILVFAMKTDGDLFLLEIHSNDLQSNNRILAEFHGPIRILPSTFDNYGIDHGQSTFICLKNSQIPLLIFTRDRSELNQCCVLLSSTNEYHLFTIDTISFDNILIISIIEDPFSSNRYFILDSKGNIYLIELPWIEQVKQGLKQFQSTRFQHLINGKNSTIKQISLIQINQHENYLSIIQQSQNKELILLHLQSNENFHSNEREFLDRIRLLLYRNQSIPYLSLSTSSRNISQNDFEKNLLHYLQIFSNEYIYKQEKVKQELENKRNYLTNLSQTQLNENQNFIQKFQNIRNHFQRLKQQYEQELSRQQRLSAQLNDVLSVIEQNTPILSNAEIHMREQLGKYQIQFDCLKDSFQRAQRFISSEQNEKHTDYFQDYLSNYRNQIEQMKQRLQTIENNQ